MKLLLSILIVLFGVQANAQSDLEPMLFNHLKESHSENNWFVTVNSALQNLSAEQASWSDGSGNHSVGQLAHHLLFWNERMLKNFKGQKNEDFSGNNNETFDKFDAKQWADLVANLDKVLTELETIVQNATDDQLKEWASVLVNISAHNAYHTGQIVFVRKLQGSWKSEYGVN